MLLLGALSPGRWKDVPSAAQNLHQMCKDYRMVKGNASPSSSSLNFQFLCICAFSFACRGWTACFESSSHENFYLCTLFLIFTFLHALKSQFRQQQTHPIYREREEGFLSVVGMLQFLNCPETTSFLPLNSYIELIEHQCGISWMKLIL